MKGEHDISACVRGALEAYFQDLDGQPPHAVYDMMLACVEQPLLQFVLDYALGNQSKAAEILGVNRNTLRKKMKLYQLQ